MGLTSAVGFLSVGHEHPSSVLSKVLEKKYIGQAGPEILWARTDCRNSAQVTEYNKRVFIDLFSLQSDWDEQELSRLADYFIHLSQKHDFDPGFILAVIRTESGFQYDAISDRGAIGLMQLTPVTALRMMRANGIETSVDGMTQALFDPFFNLKLGIGYLAELRDRYDGHAQEFLAAYLAGPARVDQVKNGKRPSMKQAERYTQLIHDAVNDHRMRGAVRCRGMGV